MIIVREVFIAKPGMASKLAKMMKESRPSVTVMTDMTGAFNKVVIESQYENLAAFEAEMMAYMKGEKKMKAMVGYTEMYSRGNREIYRLW